MKPNNVLVNAVLAAVVAAATAAGTSYLFLRYAPMGPQSANPERIERMLASVQTAFAHLERQLDF